MIKLQLVCLIIFSYITLVFGLKCCHQEAIISGNGICDTPIDCQGSCATQQTLESTGKTWLWRYCNFYVELNRGCTHWIQHGDKKIKICYCNSNQCNNWE